MHDIRFASVADIAVIARHRVRMFGEMKLLAPGEAPAMMERTLRFLERAIPSGEYVGWLAVDRRDPQGVAGGAGLQLRTVLPFPFGDGRGVGAGREALVINVYTEPQFRRLGLARRMMEALIAWSKTIGVERIALHASLDGQPLYESLGFSPTNEMRLQVAPPS
jgi:GNAT superfamily N-acetyltransferase